MCSLMEKINNTSGTDRKKRILKSFVDKWREAHNKLHSTQAATTVSSCMLQQDKAYSFEVNINDYSIFAGNAGGGGLKETTLSQLSNQ